MSARRLLLSTTALELLRRRVLPPPLSLPPGFGLEPVGGDPDRAVPELLNSGVAIGGPKSWDVHPDVADDLRVLAHPELAVLVRAARPGLDVTACLAVSGPRGASLLRTGNTAVRLSCFAADTWADELASVVPAPTEPARGRDTQEVALDGLLDPARAPLHASGTLRATVLAGARPDRSGSVVGSALWAWDGGGWVGLDALPSRAGRPWVRLVPVAPADLGAWVASYVATAAA